MKKFLLFALVAMIGMPVLAQDEIGDDVTKYVINAGFEDDLTFQADGSMKEAIKTTYSLSDRSWAYECADSTVYARPKSTSSKTRPDGRKMEAVNGFKGRVQGWTLETNGEYPKCEWTYFGTVPYALKNEAVCISDDTNGYMTVPERPTEFDGGEGFLYLRAGWTNQAIYKQVVKLPCATYRLEYWTINLSPSATAVAKDLSQITCRKDVFKDEDGVGVMNTTWTKHEFEFTPTAEFTMQFGFQAADNTSNSNPIVALDGIKLVKIDEADEVQIRQSDCWDLIAEIEAYALDSLADYAGIGTHWSDVQGKWENAASSEDVEELKAVEAQLKELKAKYQQAMLDVVTLQNLINQAEDIRNSTDYPGKDALSAAIDKASTTLEEGDIDDIAAGITELRNAMVEYYMSQEGISEDNPVDITEMFVMHPWFIEKSPTFAGGYWDFEHADEYTEGSAPSDTNTDGWYIGQSGGDQRTNYIGGLTCWNAWNNNFSSVSINQDISGLPQGFYKVSAQMVTQDGLVTDQHVFIKGQMGTANSPVLNPDNMSWDGGVYETLTTTSFVVPGNTTVTIGAWGTGGEGAAGWFCVTNFRLLYCGPATDEQVAEALAARIAEVNSAIDGMHFAADKVAAKALVEEYNNTKDMAKLDEAATLAETSEAKYDEIMMEGKTIPTVEAGLAEGTYGEAAPIAQFALNYVNNWIASAEATYTEVDNQLNLVKNYVNNYIPAYQNAEQVLAETNNQTAKDYLANTMASQKKALCEEMKDGAAVQEYIDELNRVVNAVNNQNSYEANPDATDYTSFIRNPQAQSEAGWNLFKGTGNNNTNVGEYFNSNDSQHRYFDSYNSEKGALNFYGYQEVIGLPNGSYKVKAAVRGNGEGFFLFTSNGGTAKADTTWTEMPIQFFTHTDDETGEEVTDTVTNYWGAIWQDADERFKDMLTDDPDYYEVQGIANAHDSQGFGWMWMELPEAEVKDHKLVIGFSTDQARTGKAFTGNWFSVTDFTLTMTKKGDNSGWEGPIVDGIDEVVNSQSIAIDGIYTVTGARVNSLQKGLNIVVSNGKAMKVLVK